MSWWNVTRWMTPVTVLHSSEVTDDVVKVSSHKIHSKPCLCLSVQQSSDVSRGLI